MSFPKGYPVTSANFVQVELNTAGAPNALSTSGTTIYPLLTFVNMNVPVILAPNGTIATNGTVTLGTALPVVYAGAWVWFPAGAVVGGLAGLYWVAFSSTTVGVVNTNYLSVLTPSQAVIPVAAGAAVGSNSAYTQTTAADVALVSYTVPGGTLGSNGQLRSAHEVSVFNSAGTKTYNVKFGGTTIATTGVTTVAQITGAARIRNRGSQAVQVFPNSATGGAQGTSTALVVQAAIDTTAAQPLVYSANLAVATDYVVIEGLTIELFPY